MKKTGGQDGGDRVLLVYAFLPEGTDGRAMSRAAWRMAVDMAATEYNISPEVLTRAEGPHGKPFFSGCPEIRFNISHSGCCIACAFAGGDVGLDVQVRTGRTTDKVARRIFDEESYAAYLASEDREDFFYTRWVRLESRLKRTGEGFSVPLDRVALDGCFSFPTLREGYYAAVNTAGPHTIVLREMDGTAVPVPSQDQ